MSTSSEAQTAQRQQRVLLWLPLFLFLAWLTWQTIGNHVDLGVVEPDGGNNPVDDIIKGAMALATIVALEELFHAFTGRRWLSVLLAALCVPLLVVGGYWLEIAVYGLF